MSMHSVAPQLASTCAAIAIAILHPALPCVADGPAVAIFEAKCAAGVTRAVATHSRR